MVELERLEADRQRLRLGEDQLELIAAPLDQRCARLGRDTDPVNAVRNGARAVRLDRDLESLGVQRVNEDGVELQGWLATGADDIGHATAAPGPVTPDVVGQCDSRTKGAATLAIGADKVRVTEPADRRGTILFPPRPEVAASKAQKDGGTSGLLSLPLERVETRLDGVDLHGAKDTAQHAGERIGGRRAGLCVGRRVGDAEGGETVESKGARVASSTGATGVIGVVAGPGESVVDPVLQTSADNRGL